MSRLMIALMVAAGLGIAASASAQTTNDTYTMTKKHAESQFKVDKGACASLSGNTRDICLAEARGNERMARADADAVHLNTPKARENARVVHAQAAYDVSVEKCDDLAGNVKDVCVKEAKAALVKGKANAKVDRVVADTSQDAATKQADARKEAMVDKRDADFKVALEKCDALAGSPKDACVSSAKAQFGKS
jgi:hypothetical protein